MRWIFFDLETTGLRPDDGHRVFEIGAVEVVNRVKTGKVFHKYLNPERQLSPESKEICRIEDEFLTDKEKFYEIADDFRRFIHGKDNDVDTILFAHNARFDVGFLNAEFKKIDITEVFKGFTIIDTVKLARVKFPTTSVSLDNLCKYYNIELSDREKLGHGALLDSALLCDMMIKMCENDSDDDVINFDRKKKTFFGFSKQISILAARTFALPEIELEAHRALLVSKIKPATEW